MEAKVSYRLMRGFVQLLGWDMTFKYLQQTFMELDLYSVSQDWFDDPKFILKAKGTKGDLIISFL
jgi:hypothetical protein